MISIVINKTFRGKNRNKSTYYQFLAQLFLVLELKYIRSEAPGIPEPRVRDLCRDLSTARAALLMVIRACIALCLLCYVFPHLRHK